MSIGTCKGHRYKHTEFQCLIGIEKIHKHIECAEQSLLQMFSHHISLQPMSLGTSCLKPLPNAAAFISSSDLEAFERSCSAPARPQTLKELRGC